jgi:invasion protein IalB
MRLAILYYCRNCRARRLAWVVLCFGLWVAPSYACTLEGGTVRSQHGDWQVVCRAPPPGARNEVCAAIQCVTAEDNQNVGLTAMVQKYSGGQTILRVVTSLGVFLEKGLGVQIDDRSEGAVPFDRCLPAGCQAQLLLDAPQLTKLRSGKTLVFIIYRTRESGVGIPISLAGFGQAYNNLR